MGFLMIVIIIVIIGLVFFAFSLRQKGKNIEPKAMQQEDLLQAVLLYSTDCELNNEMLNVRELIQECNEMPSRTCENDNIRMCSKLEENLESMLEVLLGKNQSIKNAFIHGYSFYINASQEILIEKGNLTGDYFSSRVPIPVGYGSEAIIVLKSYYS